MKVAVFGNLANVGASLARFLSETGHQADLFLSSREVSTWELFNPEMNHRKAKYVHFTEGTSLRSSVRRVTQLHRYDCAISVCLSGMWWLPLYGIPYFSYATGSDLRELAVGIGYRGPVVRAAKNMFQRARAVFFSPDPKQFEAAKKLNLTDLIPFRQFVDSNFWAPLRKQGPFHESRKLSIFHPANQHWVPEFEGQTLKANNVLFSGFKLFLETGGQGSLKYLNRGIDRDRTAQLVKDLSISNHVQVVGDNLNPLQLKDQMLNCNVVADQFHAGGTGLVALEAMSAARPVIISLDRHMARMAYPEPEHPPPVCEASDPEDVARQLHLLQNTERRIQASQEAAKWIDQYHHPHKLALWYADHIARRLNRD